MRTSSALLVLPALASAQQFPIIDQVKGWLNGAASSVSSAAPSGEAITDSIPSASDIPNPIAEGAAKYADLKVTPLTLENWRSTLVPGAATASPGLEEWMIFVTGGNKSCHGRCARANNAWNEAVPLLEAGSSNPPNLAKIDCEVESVLCHAWAVAPPSCLHMLLPQPLPDQSTPPTTVRSLGLNRTTITAPEIAAIHLDEKYQDKPPYEGFFHPFDGPLAQYGLQEPVGYVLWGFAKIPSWAFMITISMVSRQVM